MLLSLPLSMFFFSNCLLLGFAANSDVCNQSKGCLDDVATSFVQIARNQVHGNRGKSLLKADAVQSFQKLVGAKSSRGQALQPSVDEQIRMRFEKQSKAESMHVDEEADRMSYVRD